MKSILLAMIFNILFVDSKTKEPLTGVRVETDKKVYFSDFNGCVDIPVGEKVKNVSYVSYNSIEKPFNSKDTIIKLSEKF